MKKTIYAFASVLCCLNAAAQYAGKHSVPDFNALDAGSSARITLVQSDSDYVILHSKNPLDKLQNIQVDGGVLKVNSPIGGNVEVHVKNLTSVKVSDAAKVTCADTLKTDNLTLIASDASHAEICTHAHILKARSKDASHIIVSGTADSLNVKASDGAHINANDLKALHVHAVSSDGSNVSVWAVNSISANATDGSNIHIKGNPAQKDTHTTDGGVILTSDTNNESASLPQDTLPAHEEPPHITEDEFMSMGFVTGGTRAGAPVKYGASREFIIGFGQAYKLTQWNALGWDVYYKSTGFYLNQDSNKTFPNKTLHQSEKISFQNFGALIYDRFYMGKNLFLDGGIYGDWTFHSKHITWDDNVHNASSVKTIERNLSYVHATNYGITVRFGMRKGVSAYFNYRLSNLFKTPAAPAAAYPQLPVYTIGIMLNSF